MDWSSSSSDHDSSADIHPIFDVGTCTHSWKGVGPYSGRFLDNLFNGIFGGSADAVT
jgi:hypothetical protein